MHVVWGYGGTALNLVLQLTFVHGTLHLEAFDALVSLEFMLESVSE